MRSALLVKSGMKRKSLSVYQVSDFLMICLQSGTSGSYREQLAIVILLDGTVFLLKIIFLWILKCAKNLPFSFSFHIRYAILL